MEVENKENVRAVQNQNLPMGGMSAGKDSMLKSNDLGKSNLQKGKEGGDGQKEGGSLPPIVGEGNKAQQSMANDYDTILQKNKEMAERRPQQIREAGQKAHEQGLQESKEAYVKGRQAHKAGKGKKAAVAPQAFDAIPEHDKESVDITSKNAQFVYKKGKGKSGREQVQDKAQELSSAMSSQHKRDHEAFIQGKAGEVLDSQQDFMGQDMQDKKRADIKKNKEAFGEVLQEIPNAGPSVLHHTQQEGSQRQSGQWGQQLGQNQQQPMMGQFTDGTETFHGPKGDSEFMDTEWGGQQSSEMQGIGTGFGSMQQTAQGGMGGVGVGQSGSMQQQLFTGGEQLNVKDTIFNTGMPSSQQQGGALGGGSQQQDTSMNIDPPRI